MLPSMERGVVGRRPLLMTRDAVLVESVQRLAAVAGIDVQLDAEGRASWSSAPLVLIGDDLAASLASMHLPRRPGVIVIAVGASVTPSGVGQGPPSGERIWRDAVALGAEHVALLPEGESWLVQRLGEAADGPVRNGHLTAVLGAAGGCGVSTLSVALAVAAQESSLRTMLIDGDPDGGGLDLLFGAESLQGIRWPDLADARGRVSATTLDYALPHPAGVALLSHARPRGTEVDRDAATSVLDAALRGYDEVIVDLARQRCALADVVLDRPITVITLIPASIRGIAAGLALLTSLRERGVTPVPVLRALHRGVDRREAARVLGDPDLCVLPESPAVIARANQGDATVPNDAYGKAVRSIGPSAAASTARAA